MGKAVILIVLLILLMIAVSVLIVLLILRENRSDKGNAYGSGGIDVQTGRESGEVLHGFHGVYERTMVSCNAGSAHRACAVLEDCTTRKQYRVDLSTESVIGRTVKGYPSINDVSVSSSVRVSRRHCAMYLAGGTVMLRNLSRTTLAAINDRPIEDSSPVCQGDLIRLGDVQLRVIQIQL